MKKKCLYISILFVLVFCFRVELDALTCTYQNPYDINGEDIVIEFSSKVDKKGKVDNKEVNTCIDQSKSSFFGESFDLYFWNPTPNNLGIYDADSFFTLSYKPNIYWAFSNSYSEFVGKDCTSNIFGAEAASTGKNLTCPDLQIYSTYKASGSNVKMVNVITTKKTFPGNDSSYTQLVLKNGSIQDVDNDGNVTQETKIINTCNYTLNVSRMQGNGNTFTADTILEVQGWNNGTTKFKLDGYDVEIDTSKKYPFDIYTNVRQAYFVMSKDNVNKFSVNGNASSGYTFDCLDSGYVYYDKNLRTSSGHKGAYVITFSKSDVPSSGDYVMFGKYADDNPIYGQLVGEVNKEIGTCVSYLGSASVSGTVAEFLDDIYTIIKILSIIIVIVWSMLDLTKVIVNNKDELMSVVKKCVTRLIVLIIILLLPTIIDMIGGLFGIDDILCGIK